MAILLPRIYWGHLLRILPDLWDHHLRHAPRDRSSRCHLLQGEVPGREGSCTLPVHVGIHLLLLWGDQANLEEEAGANSESASSPSSSSSSRSRDGNDEWSLSDPLGCNNRCTLIDLSVRCDSIWPLECVAVVWNHNNVLFSTYIYVLVPYV